MSNFLTSKESIKEWLNEIGIYDFYTINDDLTVDLHTDVYLVGHYDEEDDFLEPVMEEFKVQFGVAEGDFSCDRNDLISLVGAPRIVKDEFSCHDNSLKSLEGSPEVVEAGFYCTDNPEIKDISDAPKEIHGAFFASWFNDDDYRNLQKKREAQSLSDVVKLHKKDLPIKNSKRL